MMHVLQTDIVSDLWWKGVIRWKDVLSVTALINADLQQTCQPVLRLRVTCDWQRNRHVQHLPYDAVCGSIAN